MTTPTTKCDECERKQIRINQLERLLANISKSVDDAQKNVQIASNVVTAAWPGYTTTSFTKEGQNDTTKRTIFRKTPAVE